MSVLAEVMIIVYMTPFILNVTISGTKLQVAAERTPRFGRCVARNGVGVEQCGVCR
jgi:hypothetical protein